MTVTVTVRPGGARTEVRNVPFGKASDGYGIVGDTIGATQRGQVKYGNHAFTVSRPHTTRLIEALAAKYKVPQGHPARRNHHVRRCVLGYRPGQHLGVRVLVR